MKNLLLISLLLIFPLIGNASEDDFDDFYNDETTINKTPNIYDTYEPKIFIDDDYEVQLESASPQTMKKIAAGIGGGVAGSFIGALTLGILVSAFDDCDPKEEDLCGLNTLAGAAIGLPLGAVIGAGVGVSMAANKDTVSLSAKYRF